MEIKQDFKRIKRATATALVLSALLLAFVCTAPQLIMHSLSDEVRPMLDDAREAVLRGEPEKALREICTANELITNKRELLMLFFDHSAVFTLEEAAESVERLATVGDVEQLLTELTGIETELEYMLHLNAAEVHNLF